MKFSDQAVEVARTLLRTVGVEPKRYSTLAMACDLLTRTSDPPPVFVQVGANNGTDLDDFFEVVTRNRLAGIVVEPVPIYFTSLSRAYERYPEVRPVNAALHPSAKTMTMYLVKPEAAKHPWQHGLASFSREHLTNHVCLEAVAEQDVTCVSFSELVEHHLPDGRIDILAIDTEGFDAEVLKMVDFSRFRPAVLRFEHKHLDRAEYAALRQRLTDHGYRLYASWLDCTAVQAGLASRLRYLLTMLKPRPAMNP